MDQPKPVNLTRQDQNLQHQGGRGQYTQDQEGRGYNRNRPSYDGDDYHDPNRGQYYDGPPPGYYDRGYYDRVIPNLFSDLNFLASSAKVDCK